MELNYHHLHYFWAVAREGNLTKAATSLHVTPQTVSEQIRELESELGHGLFDRAGRGLVLTETGQMVFRYADQIFTLGRELGETLNASPHKAPLHLSVGVVHSVPRFLAQRLITPVLEREQSVRILCRQGSLHDLLALLATRDLDVIVSDEPMPRGHHVKGFSRDIGECPVLIMAEPALADRLVDGFPDSLDGFPMLLPTGSTALRRELDTWLEARGLRPVVVGEFESLSLLKAFGRIGAGAFAVPAMIEEDVASCEGVRRVGVVEGLTQVFYTITAERRSSNPLVSAIYDSARSARGEKAPPTTA
ncbi:MAG: LysR family transcriptional regulator [Actinobacteria bacterium]|nr:LysR family transcriptional regulator [Actinomycetota bacterium]